MDAARLCQGYLGDNIALAPKRPLQTPQREWIAGELRDYCKVKTEEFKSLDFVIPSEVDRLWSQYINGNNDNSFFIWQWINLSLLKN